MISKRYPRAVGKQPSPQLNGSFLDWWSEFTAPAPLRRTQATDYFWNAGVNVAYGREAAATPTRRIYSSRYGGDSGMKPRGSRSANRRGFFSLWGPPNGQIGMEDYNLAKAMIDQGDMDGAKALLGDLFNDVMGAIVPGWAERPQALKNIVIRPDPAKIIERVQQIAPNAGRQVVQAANANGMGIFVNTPGGQVEVTPENAQSLYGIYPFVTRAQTALGAVPTWIWFAGGVGVLALVMMRR